MRRECLALHGAFCQTLPWNRTCYRTGLLAGQLMMLSSSTASATLHRWVSSICKCPVTLVVALVVALVVLPCLLLRLCDTSSLCFVLVLLSILSSPCQVPLLLGLLCALQVTHQKWPQESRLYILNVSKYTFCLVGAAAVCLHKTALLASVSLIPSTLRSGKAVLDCLLPCSLMFQHFND